MMIEKASIAASILTANFKNLEKELKILTQNNIDILHLDVMDGNFVENISFGPAFIQSLRPIYPNIFDVHLMIKNPIKYLDTFIKAGADWVSFHYEAVSKKELKQIIQTLKKHKKKIGIAISPKTKIEKIFSILVEIDFVLIMTVEPGFGKQSIIQDCIAKIQPLKEKILKEKLKIKIEVDGGVNQTNIVKLTKLGADILVVGSAIFQSDSRTKTIQKFRKLLV